MTDDKTHFPDGQLGRKEYIFQMNFGQNLLNLVNTLYDMVIKFE